jgi:hypothetical protein
MHRFDPGAINLGDVGGVDEDERDDSPEGRRAGDAGQLERGGAEAEQGDDEDRRHAAEEVGVDDGEGAEGEEDRAGEAADDGQAERDHEDQRLGDAEDLHVQEEGVGDPGEGARELVAVEKRALDLGPARRVDDRETERREDDGGADEGDRGASAAPQRPETGPSTRYRRATRWADQVRACRSVGSGGRANAPATLEGA